MASPKEAEKHSRWYHRAVGAGIGGLVVAGLFLAKTNVDVPGVEGVGALVGSTKDRVGRMFETPPTTTTVPVAPVAP